MPLGDTTGFVECRRKKTERDNENSRVPCSACPALPAGVCGRAPVAPCWSGSQPGLQTGQSTHGSEYTRVRLHTGETTHG